MCMECRWVELISANSLASPLVSNSASPSLRSQNCSFNVPGDLWLLSHRPHNLLTAVEEYISTIFQKLFSSKVMSQLSAAVEPSLATETLRHTANVAIVVTKIAG